jgi:hypothetical protein
MGTRRENHGGKKVRGGEKRTNTMARTYVSVEIGIPAAMCYTYVKGSVNHPKFLAAYKSLFSGRECSARIVEDSGNHRIVIEETATDSLTGVRFSGWTVTYDFEDAADGRARVGISVEYGIFMALCGLTMMKMQSINEVLGRVNSLLALEQGTETATPRERAAAPEG